MSHFSIKCRKCGKALVDTYCAFCEHCTNSLLTTSYEEKEFKDNGGLSAINSEVEWHHWLEEFGYDTLGETYYEYGGIGTDIHIRCEGHLVGLKKAFEWLDKQEEADGQDQSVSRAAHT